MNKFPEALPHGELREIFPDVFFVTGQMDTRLRDSDWRFSRNMTVIRDGLDLTVVNSVRLSDEGIKKLESLGRVAHIVKLGALHGRDDAFYKNRFNAKFWSLGNMTHENGLKTDKILRSNGEMPFAGCELFEFTTAKNPESILRVDREGGILITCDALQNWTAPNQYFSDQSRRNMTEMGFFQPAGFGPLWMQLNQPKKSDFIRLMEWPFRHALCGHGDPLLNTAKEDYSNRLRNTFGN